MKKACPYCKQIHDTAYICPNKPKQQKENTDIVNFRNSRRWQIKRHYIRERDRNMCRLCAVGYDNKPVYYNPDVSVHHIVPLIEAWSLRLEDDNLICLCSYHHELAENGKISREFLQKTVKSNCFISSRAN